MGESWDYSCQLFLNLFCNVQFFHESWKRCEVWFNFGVVNSNSNLINESFCWLKKHFERIILNVILMRMSYVM